MQSKSKMVTININILMKGQLLLRQKPRCVNSFVGCVRFPELRKKVIRLLNPNESEIKQALYLNI